MGRPLKLNADWFAHDAHASAGQTLTILENHFGMEGYAAWFKLLEIITSNKNHVIDVRNPESMEFLAARMKLKPDHLRVILDKMASLEAIDRELWTANVIWCQNLVDNLSQMYHRRNQIPPHRPEVSGYTNPVSVADNSVSGVNNATEKVEKVEKVEKERVYPYQDIVLLWLDLVPSLPKPDIRVKPSSSRATAIRARWDDNPDLETFRAIFTKVEASDFLKGSNDRKWRCNFDWVMNLTNWQKIKEGNYDNRQVGRHSDGLPGNRVKGAFSDVEPVSE